MIIPNPLKKGDTIGFISLSSSVPKELLKLAVKNVERLGFKVFIGETCKEQHTIFAGHHELRARELNEMFSNTNINGIFCVSGGYGALRILPYLDYELIKANPKVFTGYSDVTAVHIGLNQKSNLVTYHAPMPVTEFIQPQMDEYSWQSFLSAVMNTKSTGYFIRNPDQTPMTTLVEGKGTGVLTGGNLSLVVASLGTPFEIDTRDKILFLEDVDEHAARIDRMLTQLNLAGKFDKVKGIILGTWANCRPTKAKNGAIYTIEEVFESHLRSLKVPVIMNVACGHGLPTMSLPLGRAIAIDASKKNIEIK